MTEELLQTWSKFAKGAVVMAQKGELLEARLNSITAAENARKARSRQPNKVFQSGGILYAKDARRMVRERLELEERREQEREEAREKRFTQAHKNVLNKPKNGER